MDKVVCPHCKSKNIEEHEIGMTFFKWYLCRDCSHVWDDVPKKKEREKDDEGQRAD